MIKSLGLLVGGTVALWLLIVYPARVFWGQSAVMFSAVAGVLCLLPTAATLVWSRRALGGSPEQALLAVFGGTGLRMILVVGAGMVLFHTLEPLHQGRFWVWVVFFYLVTLTLEMVLLLIRPASWDVTDNKGS